MDYETFYVPDQEDSQLSTLLVENFSGLTGSVLSSAERVFAEEEVGRAAADVLSDSIPDKCSAEVAAGFVPLDLDDVGDWLTEQQDLQDILAEYASGEDGPRLGPLGLGCEVVDESQGLGLEGPDHQDPVRPILEELMAMPSDSFDGFVPIDALSLPGDGDGDGDDSEVLNLLDESDADSFDPDHGPDHSFHRGPGRRRWGVRKEGIKIRKKRQNREAAVRYRLKKKMEKEESEKEVTGLLTRNRQLKSQVAEKEQEISILKGLLRELRVKRLQNS